MLCAYACVCLVCGAEFTRCCMDAAAAVSAAHAHTAMCVCGCGCACARACVWLFTETTSTLVGGPKVMKY